MTENYINTLIPDNFEGKDLYHYTSAEGLIGILEKGKIRCSHILYMNDQEEFIDGWRAFFKALENFRKDGEFFKSFQTAVKNDYKSWEHISLQEINDVNFSRIHKFNFRAFIFSLSNKPPDDLDQWRSYTNGGAGFSLKFNFDTSFFTKQTLHKDELRNNIGMADTTNILLKECVYCKDHKQELIFSLLNYYYEKFIKKDNNWDVDMYFDLLLLFCLFKNKAFKEEKEYRLITLFNHDAYDDLKGKSQNKIHFRSGRSMLIPYIELNTIYSNLKGLTIGPTPLMHHSYSSVEMFLKNVRNNNKDLEFLKPNRSDVPYRTW